MFLFVNLLGALELEQQLFSELGTHNPIGTQPAPAPGNSARCVTRNTRETFRRATVGDPMQCALLEKKGDPRPGRGWYLCTGIADEVYPGEAKCTTACPRWKLRKDDPAVRPASPVEPAVSEDDDDDAGDDEQPVKDVAPMAVHVGRVGFWDMKCKEDDAVDGETNLGYAIRQMARTGQKPYEVADDMGGSVASLSKKLKALEKGNGAPPRPKPTPAPAPPALAPAPSPSVPRPVAPVPVPKSAEAAQKQSPDAVEGSSALDDCQDNIEALKAYIRWLGFEDDVEIFLAGWDARAEAQAK